MNQISKQRQIVDRLALNEQIAAVLGDDGYSSLKRAEILDIFKARLQGGHGEVRRRFEAGGAGGDAMRGNSFLIDQLIRVIFDLATGHAYPVANPTTAESVSVVAVGGYGRQRLAPHSDIDLLFLLPYKETPYSEQVIEYLLYMLWDLGLKVGHATRSTADCIRLAKQDVTIQTSLLDARYLWGDQGLFAEFKAKYQADVIDGTGPQFVEAKLAERDARHDRMGDSRYVVEPNIKEGKGGLRDLQTLYWLSKYLYGADDVAELARLGVYTPQDAKRYSKACDFLWTVRCHLHYLTDRAEERLSFEVQKAIGEAMGYADRAGIQGVERFMKHYFLIAKDVGDLTRVLCAVLEEQQKKRSFFRLPGLPRRKAKIDGFEDDGGRVTVSDDNAFRDDPVKLIRIFNEAHKHDLDIHPEALRLISRDLKYLNNDVRNDPIANKEFLDILTSPKNPEIALRRLNEAGVFGKFIPDFGRVVAQMQYDMYHFYTVDEHTIRAIGILSRIEAGKYKDEMPNVTQATNEILSRRALYVAVLLHDIAKGRGGDHSEIGAGVAMELCPRLGLSQEETETVAWLVRMHLTMSDTAFKRDIDDPQTIQGFVDLVQSVERLRLLAVLTVADIRAVGPNTWNNWKSGLLRGLYQRALETMSGDMVGEHREHRVAHAKDQLRDALGDWPEAELESHIATGYPAYWLAYDTQTHRRHAEIVREAKAKGSSLHIDTRIDDEFEYSEITVYTPDHPGIFSKIAGAMALSGATIMDAKIVTMSDGMVLDSFFILDSENKAYAQPDRLERLWRRIEDVLAGKLYLDQELAKASSSSLSNKEELFTVATRILVDNNASASDTVIEVNGRDRLGFLYDVTTALNDCGLKISSAHIATFGEHVVDTFYVKDVFGLKVTHDGKIDQIRKKLVSAVEQADAEKESAAAE